MKQTQEQNWRGISLGEGLNAARGAVLITRSEISALVRLTERWNDDAGSTAGDIENFFAAVDEITDSLNTAKQMLTAATSENSSGAK